MGLKPQNKKDFEVVIRDPRLQGENIVFIKGGSTIVDNKWTQDNDLRLDVKALVEKYVQGNSRRLFNNFGDIIYVLIVRDKNGKIEVIPSLAYSKKTYGNIKVFPELSGKMPLVLVKLEQDGSAGLTGIRPLTKSDYEVYLGYGNFTLRGEYGPTGYAGYTGVQGITGPVGDAGDKGTTGHPGYTGASGDVIQGETGPRGDEGPSMPTHIVLRPGYIQDVVDESEETWYDVYDDSIDQVQDTP